MSRSPPKYIDLSLPLSPSPTKHGESLTLKFLKRVGNCVIRIASIETEPFVQATRSLKWLNDKGVA